MGGKCKAVIRLPDEIWIEIMWKLSIKPLHLCTSVCKTWYSFVTYILSCQKGLELPPYGLLFLTRKYEPIINWRLAYLSFSDRKITIWPMSEEPEPKPETAIVGITDHQNTIHKSSLGNLILDFSSCLFSDRRRRSFWTMHRGLVLIGSVATLTFYVYNPVTKEKFVLPKPPSLAEGGQFSKRLSSLQGAIINLSDCLLSTQCNFRVIRLTRLECSCLADVYSSTKNKWFQSVLDVDRAVIKSKWSFHGSVILDKTVFFITSNRHLLGIKLLSGENLSASCLSLPQPIQTGIGDPIILHVSQGCLYLSYYKPHDLWIWKHDGRSLDAQAWIPQLIFKDSGTSLCQPVAKKYLSQMVGNSDHTFPVTMHPEAPVVFILMLSSIYAFHLLNDTVEKIVELKDNTITTAGFNYLYTPCFASLKCLTHQNHSS